MAQKIIKFEDEYDFGLIGISYHNKARKLCWELNQNLGLDFSRSEDLKLILEDQESAFPLYEHFDEDEFNMHLISNKGNNAFLIPERKNCDYFIVIDNDERGIFKEVLLKKLKNINQLNMAFDIDPESLKSKGNLLLNDI